MHQERRKNGLSPPYSGPQVGAWLALIALSIEFPVVVSPILPIEASIPVTIFVGGLLAASFYFGYQTQVIDPMDAHLAQHLKSLDNAENGNATNSVPDEPLKQCWICDIQVAEHAMHCKFCNKCVSKFDHHCMWLNTCIGKENYEYFFRLMVALFALNFCQLSIHAVLVVDSFTSGPTNDRQENSFIPVKVSNALLIFFACFNAVTIFLIGQLLWFHIGLRQEQLTTYQYIIQDHKKKREEQRRLDELEQRRIHLMSQAFQDGKSCYAYQLRLGRICRKTCGKTGSLAECCDPLELPGEAPEPNPDNAFAGALGGSTTINENSSGSKDQQTQSEEAATMNGARSGEDTEN